MIRTGKKYNFIFAVIISLWAFLSIVSTTPAWSATSILNVDQNTSALDISEFGKAVPPTKSILTIQGPGDAQAVDLVGKGPGPEFYWSLYSIHNSSDVALDFIIEVEPQHFAGSGLLRLLPFGNTAVGAVATAGPDIIKPYGNPAQSAYAFTIARGQTLNIAIESNGTSSNPTLWKRSAFESQLANSTFFLGLVLGVAFLVTLSILALYSFRPHNALLAGWLFAFASLLFMLSESGLLSQALQAFSTANLSSGIIRATIETIFAVALLLCVLSFTSIRKKNPLVGFFMILLFTLLGANFIYAFVDVDRATSASRFAFGLIVLLGFVITAWCRRTQAALVDSGFLFWLSIGAWTVLAGILTQAAGRKAGLSIVLVAALAAVLVALALVLLRFVFTQGLASKPFITDANRRSLALTSARHVLWDWQIADHFLDVGEELPKSLGFDPRTWGRNAEQRFVEAMHPIDAAAYLAEIDGDRLQVGRNFDLDLRLRNAEGSYRWFELRARVVPGPNQMPDRCIGTLTDVTKQKENEERLLLDAVHDPVTGLPSRALFMDRFDRELGKPLGLQLRMLLIDLDRFKTLNDALGHDQGDRLLQAAGARIQDCLTDDESVARISGSQFAVLAIETLAQRTARDLAKSIAEALSETIVLGQQEISLTCSIGISNQSERGLISQDMQKQAASALLEATRLGGGKIIMFNKKLKDNRASDLAFESELRRAISKDEIEIHFQPICRLADLSIAGLEALARWRHPTKGLLPPLEFIALAEQAGMIGEIGQIVLASAARQLGVWQRVLRRDDHFFVSVNISPTHFLAAGFLEQVQAVIAREGLKPSSLKIEVTESVIMRHPDRALRLFERLRSLGVGLACDDFGTGFSNLSSIRDLPFDTLKIDRSFLTPESFDTRGGMIITTITDLAHGLGMMVVAEGIETQMQIDRLAQLGCDLGQGYFIGEPKPANDITDMLAVLPRFVEEQMPSRFAIPVEQPPLELEVLPSIFELPKTSSPLLKRKLKVKKPIKRSKK